LDADRAPQLKASVRLLRVYSRVSMNSHWKYLLLLLVLISLAACRKASIAKEYGYVFYESTGQNQYILVNSKEVPFSFDKERSDKMALGSLRALSARVLYPNSQGGKIILVGDYDARTQLFKLDHWYLQVPFIEITLEDTAQMPEEIHQISRASLERTDFAKRDDFDPNALEFDPKKYERKESP
jgi:hypothetical protein